MKRFTVFAAALVIIVANVLTLVSVAINRRSTHGGVVELTERELRLPRMTGESTVRFLVLEWDTLHNSSHRHGTADWLDTEKMMELGFNVQPVQKSSNGNDDDYRHYTVSVYIVLEYEGETWQQAPPDRRKTTRLFAIDAGHDPRELRELYPDESRYIITRGLIRSFVQHRKGPEQEWLEEPYFRGYIQSLIPRQVYTLKPYNAIIRDLQDSYAVESSNRQADPRFIATISWGSRYEPWLTSLHLTETDTGVE